MLVSAANLRLKGATRSYSPAKAHHWVAHLHASVEVPLLARALAVQAILVGWWNHFTFHASLVVLIPSCILSWVEPWNVWFDDLRDVAGLGPRSFLILHENFRAQGLATLILEHIGSLSFRITDRILIANEWWSTYGIIGRVRMMRIRIRCTNFVESLCILSVPKGAALFQFGRVDLHSRNRAILVLFELWRVNCILLRLPLVRKVYHGLVHGHEVDGRHSLALAWELDGCRSDLTFCGRTVQIVQVASFNFCSHGDFGHFRWNRCIYPCATPASLNIVTIALHADIVAMKLFILMRCCRVCEVLGRVTVRGRMSTSSLLSV